jgi:hypothetical protein
MIVLVCCEQILQEHKMFGIACFQHSFSGSCESPPVLLHTGDEDQVEPPTGIFLKLSLFD